MHSDQRIGGSPGSPFSSLLTRVQVTSHSMDLHAMPCTHTPGAPSTRTTRPCTSPQTSINELRQEVAAARQESVVTADHVRKGVCPPHAVAKRAAPAAPPGHLAHALKSPTHTPGTIQGAWMRSTSIDWCVCLLVKAWDAGACCAGGKQPQPQQAPARACDLHQDAFSPRGCCRPHFLLHGCISRRRGSNVKQPGVAPSGPGAAHGRRGSQHAATAGSVCIITCW